MSFLGVYRALYDYNPQSAEELEINDGDLLFLLSKSSDEGDDWWTCKKKALDEDDDEPEGLVPSNYIEPAKPTHSAKAQYDYTKQTDEELSFEEGARLEVYDETDPDWTLVGTGGAFGFAPAIYIEAVKDAPMSAPVSGGVAAPPPPMPPRQIAVDDGPLPGEADYVPPSSSSPTAATNPADAIASIISQRTGSGATEPSPAARRALASPPPPSARPQQYTPDESEEEEAPPPKPARPQSQQQQQLPSPPSRSPAQYTPSAFAEGTPIQEDDYDRETPGSPRGYHLYNIHEMVTYMGKSKKLPMTLGINVQAGKVMISPEKSRDGPSQEWTAEKLSHYSIEGKHVFLELVRPSKSVDFHAGAKDTANEIVAHLGELAGASRMGGMQDVIDASQGGGLKKGVMVYEFEAQGDDEVTVAEGDEVAVLDDSKSEEWWMVRRLKNGREGVVPSSYVEITGTVSAPSGAGLSSVEQNRLEEERLAKEAARKDKSIPERGSSLAGPETMRSSKSHRDSKRSGAGKAKPNNTRVRTWTDRSGTFKVEAEFIGLREGKIHLHKLNGVKIAVPVAKMAVEDLEYVEKATGASLDEDKPLSDIKRRSTQRAGKKDGGAGASVEKGDREKRAKDEDYWFDFFLQCGVDHKICGRYASAFARDSMGEEVLQSVNEPLLRTLGLKEGDILRVMKHLDAKYGRGEGAGGEGGLFAGPGGALKNNTRKGRPAPAVQTNDVVSEEALRRGGASPTTAGGGPTPTIKEPGEGARETVLASAPAREPRSGFEDDAWDVRPARRQTPEASRAMSPEPLPAEPARPKVNDDLASLSLLSPPLQPTLAAPAASASPSSSVQSPSVLSPQQTAQPTQQQGADQAIFDKIASLAPSRQRPQPPPPVQQSGGNLSMPPPPPRAASAPGFQPQQNGFGAMPLQPQLTGYNPQQQQAYQGQGLQPQQTAFQYQQGMQQPNGYPQAPQQTGVQAMQQNFPALQPQPTGLNFQPQSQFGQQSHAQHYGQLNPNYHQQQLVNGTQTGSPFADPPRQPYQPSAPSGLQNSFAPQGSQLAGFQQQQTAFQQQQQPQFNISQPTGGMNGMNGYQPAMPPQQTGGVFGPSQPAGGLNAPPAPLQPQKTGPAPPVRFGVTGVANKLVAQPTGRANLAKATPQNPFGF